MRFQLRHVFAVYGGRAAVTAAILGVGALVAPAYARRDAPLPITVQAADDGYNVSGAGFSMHIARTGAVSSMACHTRPLFDKAYLEVRDKTWHVKLSPHPEQVKCSPPTLDKDGEKFDFAIQIDDSGTGIRLSADERILIRPSGELQVTVAVTPQASFEARRISWNIEFPASRFKGTACAWQRGKGPQSTLQFPADQAPDPHMATDFDWMRLNCDGPVDLQFSATDAKKQPLPVENALEDLRWWNEPSFWIADSTPYPHGDGDPTKPLEVSPGDVRTIQVVTLMHCGEGH